MRFPEALSREDTGGLSRSIQPWNVVVVTQP